MEIMLLTMAFCGMVLILMTKYFVPGVLCSVLSFFAYFIIFGSGNFTHMVVLLIGLLLLGLELIIPSFGIVGIIGISMVLMGLAINSVRPEITLFNASLAILLAIAFALLLLKIGYKFQLGRGMVLKNVLNRQNGFQSHAVNYDHLLQQKGVAITNLRPVGKARFQDVEIEVLSIGNMINEGASVIIYKIEGNKIFVKQIEGGQ